ncbi:MULTISPECIES: hypothetical protein [Actinomycetes]|uniref:hypothetical protein n=1 Tax=Actinomycetes TaxID=1760 RepID=UPI0001DEE26E|nr:MULTISPECIES: hypothetical protein [Actinomycetes]EFL06837.1 predicted protein [Streptomyces sp. AA4]
MIKLSNTWHIPDGELPDAIDRYYLDVYVPGIRRLPRLRRHVVLKAIPVDDLLPGLLGIHSDKPRVWRGEDLWFDSYADLDDAMASDEWKSILAGGFLLSISGLQTDVFDIVEEYRAEEKLSRTNSETFNYVVDRGTWHIPDGREISNIDRYYFDIHVPNVRRLPSLHRHVVLKSAAWPVGRNPRTWRGADCWKDLGKLDEDAICDTEDDFSMLIAGLEFDRFSVESEWVADSVTE